MNNNMTVRWSIWTPNPKESSVVSTPSHILEVNQMKSLMSPIFVYEPMKSLMTSNESSRLADMTTRAMMPPSFKVFFQTSCPFMSRPKSRMMGKANIGIKRMSGEYSAMVLRTMPVSELLVLPNHLTSVFQDIDVVQCNRFMLTIHG